MLTKLEHQTMDKFGEFIKLLRELIYFEGCDKEVAAIDWAEMVNYIHPLQNAILANCAARSYPEKYRRMGTRL